MLLADIFSWIQPVRYLLWLRPFPCLFIVTLPDIIYDVPFLYVGSLTSVDDASRVGDVLSRVPELWVIQSFNLSDCVYMERLYYPHVNETRVQPK